MSIDRFYSLEILGAHVGGEVVPASARGISVSAVTASSETPPPRALFAALKGVRADGHAFVQRAISNGCVGALVSDPATLGDAPGLVVKDTRTAYGKIAAFLAGSPSEQMRVIGITGTNGKTTTHWLLYHALNYLGTPCIRIGTLGVAAERVLNLPGGLTTPDPELVHTVLKQALQAKCNTAVFEVSSHALDQARVDAVCFDVGVFTNLTRDHLDYHGTMEAYFAAKKRLFHLVADSPKRTRGAVINLDDPVGPGLQREVLALSLNDFSFGFSPDAPLRIRSFSQTIAGSEVTLEWQGKVATIRSRFVGRHNASNLAAACAALLALHAPLDVAARALETVPEVPGRLERVPARELGIFVDYAHTPDALEKALQTLREVTTGKLWVVFGCGGDRDKGKRPQMGLVAQKLADRVVVTSDNPRSEVPGVIIDDILASGITPFLVETDRRRAIVGAVTGAAAGDLILIAGKGHEDYQIIGTEKLHFSDVEEALNALKLRY
jgi:UDP-N-acetylmuramoyl-L-alanyl-D-glutamate--2,6-diaminopimelate ligase